MTSDRKAAHAARRSLRARTAFASAGSPEERLSAAYDWFRASSQSDRTVDAVARQLYRLAERSDARAAVRLSDTEEMEQVA